MAKKALLLTELISVRADFSKCPAANKPLDPESSLVRLFDDDDDDDDVSRR